MKKILSLLLIFSMCFGMFPITASADDTPLSLEDAELGASWSRTDLAGYSAAEFAVLDRNVAEQTVPVGTPLEELILPDELTVTVDGEESVIPGVTWQPDPEYAPDLTGTYSFTPTLPESYIITGGAKAPVIVVTVEEAVQPSTHTGRPAALMAFPDLAFTMVPGSAVSCAKLSIAAAAYDITNNTLKITNSPAPFPYEVNHDMSSIGVPATDGSEFPLVLRIGSYIELYEINVSKQLVNQGHIQIANSHLLQPTPGTAGISGGGGKVTVSNYQAVDNCKLFLVPESLYPTNGGALAITNSRVKEITAAGDISCDTGKYRLYTVYIGSYTGEKHGAYQAGSEVTVTEAAANVCEINGQGYPTLDAALADVPSAGAAPTTIKLLEHLSHDGLVIDNKKVSIDPGGKALTLGTTSGFSEGLVVKNGGQFMISGTGFVNAHSYGAAVTAEGPGSLAAVHNATSTNSFAAYAKGGGIITVMKNAEGKSGGVLAGISGDTAASSVEVRGNVTATGDQAAAVDANFGGVITVNGNVSAAGKEGKGVYAAGKLKGTTASPSRVTVNGNVQAAQIGVDASSSAIVTVKGDVTAGESSDTWAYGVWAQTQAQVTVEGSITAAANDNTSSIGAYARSTNPGTTTKITIGGTLSGKTYIKLGNNPVTEAGKDVPSADPGYHTYTGTDPSFGTHTVWVKEGASSTRPLDTPSGLAWDTATAGVIKAKWNAVTGAQGYTIMLYKNGSPVGPLSTSATSLQLIQYIRNSGTGSFTFTVRALAPSGSTEYTDSANSPHSPAHSYTAPAAIPAEGSARANLYTKSIFVTLTQGGFKAVQDKADWALGGDGASGNSIAGVSYISSTEVQITLTNDINTLDALTITATQDAFAAETAPFAAPLTVRLDNPSAYDCTIDGVAYPSLKKALEHALAPTVDNKTIVLAADIRYDEPVVVAGKSLTFDLNGKNLVIDTSGTITDDWLTASALKVDNGSVSYRGEGKFTVCGERRGVEAINGGRARVSEILIKNSGSPYPKHYYVYGAYASYKNGEGEGSQITVTGGIRTLSGKPCDYAMGALGGHKSKVTVGGDIFLEGESVIGLSAGSFNDGKGTVTAQNVAVKGESATGVSAAGESTATVNGAVTAMGAYAVGVDAGVAESGSGGTVLVKGDAAAAGDESTGVICFSSGHNPAKSLVIVDGTISGEDYLKIDNVVRTKDPKDSETGGYWVYNGQYSSVVKVKDPDGGTPGGNVPTTPQDFTATPGSGQVSLRWIAPADTGGSAITGYQVSKDGGTSWTNVGLTTAYTFTGLTNGTEYTFKVRAVNSAGSGAEASRTATPTSAPSVPTVPRNFTASPGFQRVILNWDVPASNGGSSIIRYEVSKNNGGDWTSAGLYTRYEFTGLTNGTEYTFKVRAVNSAGNGAEASAAAMPSDSAQTSFTVSFYSSGALYTSRSVMNGSALDSSWPANPTRSGYTFGGWFTGQNGGGTQYTSSSVITADVDLHANWSYNGGGGGGGGSAAPSAPAYNADIKEGTGTETKLPVTVNAESGTAVIDTGAGKLTSGNTVVTMPSIPGVDTYTIGIPVPDLSTSDAQGSLIVETGNGSITVPSNMLTGVPEISGSKAQVSIGKGDKNALPEEVKAAIGDRPLIQLTLSIDGQQTNWSNPGAAVTVSIPYTPTAAELANPESIVIWYIDGAGNAVAIPNGRYDAATGTVTFATTHFSYYGVAYRQVSFNDVAAEAWYHDAVSFIAARGITGGTGNGRYSPDAKLTRGEFIVMLMRAYEIAADVNAADNFSDGGNTWYTGHLAAAKGLGITAGVGNNMYAPVRAITRQEMYALLYNSLKALDKLPAGNSGKTLADYNDAGQVAAWAREPMELLVKAGIAGGSGEGLQPAAAATRAELAQVLYHLLTR